MKYLLDKFAMCRALVNYHFACGLRFGFRTYWRYPYIITIDIRSDPARYEIGNCGGRFLVVNVNSLTLQNINVWIKEHLAGRHFFHMEYDGLIVVAVKTKEDLMAIKLRWSL